MKQRYPNYFLALMAISGFVWSSWGIAATDAEMVKPAITGADAPMVDKGSMTFDRSLPPLGIEQTGNVATLPFNYPESWVLVDESSFAAMASGKVIVLDAAETKPAKRIKGTMDKSFLGNFAQSKKRGEFYLMETFHSRGTRGPKEDVMTVYDKQTLTIKKEIVWPKANRLQALPQRYAIGVSKDERFLFSSNFDPAASITVIDLDRLEIVVEIGTPGCVLSYPVGARAVASVCSNGAMLTTRINNDGTLKSQSRSNPFFHTDNTPIFEHPVYHQDMAYFWGFKGLLHQFDMRGKTAKYLGAWDALSPEDKKGGWRPSGLILNDIDDAGLIYTIFQPDGREGSQTHGGSQVRVYDPLKKKLIRTIDMPKWAISIAVTRGDHPLLIATNGELALDVFNALDGSLLHTISDFGSTTPLATHKSF